MPLPIEDYALLGDTETAALVGRDGSIDWLCFPRFDSAACFAALLGDKSNGRWQIGPADPQARTERRYRGNSLVLDTLVTTEGGVARVVDCMPPRGPTPDVVRVVEGVEGEVTFEMELVIRFDYGSIVPWVHTVDGVLRAIAGPDALSLWSPVPLHGVDFTHRASFTVKAGERLPFVLAWHRSHEPSPPAIDALEAVADTCRWWEHWAAQCTYAGPWKDQVMRSLIALKALTYRPTGGIVAAVTTSLPEHIGGVRNWDYRFCWVRDATFTLYSLLSNGFTTEAAEWRGWLLRSVAGDPSDLQIMYGPAGERRLTELELPWLAGYENSKPVRIGNAAVQQLQLDVYGELLDAMAVAARAGVRADADAWSLEKSLVNHLETIWQEADEGIWEMRGPRRHFTHSKVMAWVAFDRALSIVKEGHFEGPVERWRQTRAAIHEEVCRCGFHSGRNTFTQYYGTDQVDASLLLLPLVGFLPIDDPRIVGTIAAVEHDLLHQGFLLRYRSEQDVDGLPAGEGVFLACTFWLADCYALQGRAEKARALFERLLGLVNDVGLLSEEYDPVAKRLLGNFPQAFSHVSLVNTALNIGAIKGPAEDRSEQAQTAP
ncbi:MAG: glycoside hydrolase family 15 protein [Casimicrobiaceae bacterium]